MGLVVDIFVKENNFLEQGSQSIAILMY